LVEDLQQPHPGYYAEKAALIAREVPARMWLTLQLFCVEMDSQLTMETGASLMLIRHLLATKLLICDMSEALDETVPMSRFQSAQSTSRTVSV
jgi:TnsA endonuclease C terminal